MGLELRRDSKQQLRSKWWYGRYIINGKRHFTNLGVAVKGKAPKNLRKRGDMAFECSRTLAAAMPKMLTGGEGKETLDLAKEVLELEKAAESVSPEEVVKKLKVLAKAVARMTDAEKKAAVLAA